MNEREPATRKMKVSEARQQFSELLNKVYRGEERVLIDKSGIPVAGIVSVRDLERLTLLEEQREKAFAALDATREAFEDVPDEEIEREAGKAVTAARRKARSGRRSSQRPG